MSGVKRDKFTENIDEMHSEHRSGETKPKRHLRDNTPVAKKDGRDNRSGTSEGRQSEESSLRCVLGTTAGAVC